MSSLTPVFRKLILGGALASAIVVSVSAEAFNPGSVYPGRIQQGVVPLPRAEASTSIHYADLPTCKVELQFNKHTPRFRKVLIRTQSNVLPAPVEALYQPYLGYLITPQNVSQLANTVAEYYRQQGYFAAEVRVPAQNLHHGVLKVIVHEGAVGDVLIVNNSPRIQPSLQHYADQIKTLNPLTRPHLERSLLLAGQIVGSHLKADISPDKRYPGCIKVTLTADMKRLGADVGYDNFGVRWQGPHEYSANVFGNSLLQAGDHTHVNAMVSNHADELQYYAAEHNMPLGYAGTRLQLSANVAQNEPVFTLEPFDLDGKAYSGKAVISHPFILTRPLQFWARLGVRFTDEEMKSDEDRLYKDRLRVAMASVDYLFNDCWKGQSRAEVTLSQGFTVLGASKMDSDELSRPQGASDFTKFNGELSYSRPLFNNFSVRVGGQGQYSFNTLLVSELMGVGGRYWGRAYDWSEIMGDSGVVGTLELRYDTKPGAPELKNTQYFLAYDAGETWLRHAPGGHNRMSLTSLQVGLRLDFTRYLTADLVVAKPLTREVLAQELAGHSGDKIRAFFRLALHL